MEIQFYDELMNSSLTDEFYLNYMDEDNITEEWILTGSYIPIVSIITLYLLVVFKLGPEFMKGRSPYRLQLLMRIHNIVQVIYNSFIIFHYFIPINGITPLWLLAVVSCRLPQPFPGLDQLKYSFLTGAWSFILLKILDLFDTVFMVLRKKDSHITFLHVFHHVGMVFFPWFSIKFIKAPQAAIPVFINLVVHAVMYTYYLLATFDSLKKYLWWKRHLTKLQLGQFVLVILYLSLLYYWNCSISSRFTFIWVINVIAFFVLFMNFYVKAYFVKPKTESKPLKVKKRT